MKKEILDNRSKKLRAMILDAFVSARRGHVASAFSIIEILRVLFDDILIYRPKNPHWPKRDRFILSKGHACLALYSILADKGFFPVSTLKTFCKTDSMIGQHPDHSTPGVEMSTGSLGHGCPV